MAQRVTDQLRQLQKNAKVLKLDAFDSAEFDANLSVIQLIKLERAADEDDENAIVLGESVNPAGAKPVQH